MQESLPIMCTNNKYIYNKYINRGIYVRCGKCDACLQEKANARVQRIRNSISASTLPMFVTLTYDRFSVPYVLKSDLLNGNNEVNIYRDCSPRYVRTTSDYCTKLRKNIGTMPIDVLYLDSDFYDSQSRYNIVSCPALNGLHKDAIGLAYYPDLQNFFKRFKQNLSRHYEQDPKKVIFYACSELGETTYRPHFHLLLFAPQGSFAAYKSAIIESWPFADRDRTADYIEVARDAASYCASYVNCASDFPKLLKSVPFRPKHSASKGFGTFLACFGLEEILQKADKGMLTYNVKRTVGGVPVVDTLPLPKYVISRFFPKLKGYSRFTSDSLAVLLRQPSRLLHYGWPSDSRCTEEDIRTWKVRINNSFKRYKENCNKTSFEDYIIDYLRVWRCYFSTCMRLWYENSDKIPIQENYDNFNEYLNGYVCSDNLDLCLPDSSEFRVINPNEYTSRVDKTLNLKSLYQKKVKTKKVLNICMDKLGHFV